MIIGITEATSCTRCRSRFHSPHPAKYTDNSVTALRRHVDMVQVVGRIPGAGQRSPKWSRNTGTMSLTFLNHVDPSSAISATLQIRRTWRIHADDGPGDCSQARPPPAKWMASSDIAPERFGMYVLVFIYLEYRCRGVAVYFFLQYFFSEMQIFYPVNLDDSHTY